MSSPLKTQVAGTHYLGLKIQPATFAMRNCWDACAFSTLKYLTRYREKAGLIDVDKGLHFVDLREEIGYENARPLSLITMDDYIDQNDISRQCDQDALIALEWYVLHPYDSLAVAALRGTILNVRDALTTP